MVREVSKGKKYRAGQKQGEERILNRKQLVNKYSVARSPFVPRIHS